MVLAAGGGLLDGWGGRVIGDHGGGGAGGDRARARARGDHGGGGAGGDGARARARARTGRARACARACAGTQGKRRVSVRVVWYC